MNCINTDYFNALQAFARRHNRCILVGIHGDHLCPIRCPDITMPM